MNSVTVTQVILLAGIVVATILWLLDRLAPSRSASRQGAVLGLLRVYPAEEEPTQFTQLKDEGITTEYV